MKIPIYQYYRWAKKVLPVLEYWFINAALTCATITGFMLPGEILKYERNPMEKPIPLNLPQRSSIQVNSHGAMHRFTAPQAHERPLP
jgi:hypothetical protein